MERLKHECKTQVESKQIKIDTMTEQIEQLKADLLKKKDRTLKETQEATIKGSEGEEMLRRKCIDIQNEKEKLQEQLAELTVNV